MNKKFIKNTIPNNINLKKLSKNMNLIRNQKIPYPYNYKQNKGKRFIKNIQTNNQFQNFPKKQSNDLIYDVNNQLGGMNYNRLTQFEPVNVSFTNNNLFFEKSFDEKNNKNHYLKEKYNYSMKIQNKSNRFLSSEKFRNMNHNNKMNSVLINNGVINNMYINDDINKNKNDYFYKKMNYTYNNINNIDDNFYNFKIPKQKIKNNQHHINSNNNIYNLTSNNFISHNNIRDEIFNNYKYKESSAEFNKNINSKKIIDNYSFNRNNNIENLKKKNISKKISNNLTQNYFNHNININTNTYIPINQKLINNRNKTRHFYSKTNICDNNDIEDISYLPLPVHYMNKYPLEQNNKNKIILLKDNIENPNKIKKHQSYNKISTKKQKDNNNELISSSSSDELSLLADEIVNKFKRKKNENCNLSDKKRKISNIQINKLVKKIGGESGNKIKNIKIRKMKSLIIPVNINNFILLSNSKRNNDEDKSYNTNNYDKDKFNYSSICQDNKTKLDYNIKDIENNNSPILHYKNNKTILKQKIEKKDNEPKKLEKKEEEVKIKESNDEDFLLIDQIINEAENEEKNKKNRQIKFKIEDNIYIHYNSKDLINKSVVYKGNKKLELNNNDKKMDIYYALLKSKTKFNPIIKSYNKSDIKINKNYEKNEDLEEYEILGDLYNIFYSKNINDLDDKLKNSIDNFMIDKGFHNL